MKALIPPGKNILVRKSLDHPWSDYFSKSWTEGEVVQKASTKTHSVIKFKGWYAKVRNEDLRVAGHRKRTKTGRVKPKSNPVGVARTPEVRVGMRDYTPPILWRQNSREPQE
jgi:hypothetical protein